MKFAPIRNSLFALIGSLAAFFLTPIPGHAAAIWWNGQTDSMWTGFNWTTDGTDSHSGTSLPNGDLVFSATGAAHQQTTMLGADFSIHSLTFMDPAIVRMSGPYTLTVADDGSIPGYITVDAGAGYVTIENDLALNAHLLTVEGAALLRINGDIHGNVLTKDGLGSLVLAGVLDSGMTLNVNAGTVFLIRGQTLAGLHIGPGATVLLAEHGPDEPNGTKVIDTAALTIDLNGGALDLTNNAMIVRGGATNAYPALLALVQSGFYNGPAGYWDGPGVRSSTAAADGNYSLALGLVDNADPQAGFTEFAGVTGLSANDALLAFTFYGDADLNRAVDPTDQWLLDNGFQMSWSGWFNGDFDYNGAIDPTDEWLLQNAFQNQYTVSQYSDSDWDGMPDWWEMVHTLNPGFSVDAILDADSDGATNLDEYLVGTDPNAAASCPYKVLSSAPQRHQYDYATDGAVVLHLNKPLPTSVTQVSGDFVKRTTDNGVTWETVSGVTTILPGRKVISFLPTTPFVARPTGTAVFYYKIDFTVTSSGLAPVVPFQAKFSTLHPDAIGPWVQRVWPGEGYIEVATNYIPMVKWGQPLLAATVNSANISLREDGGTSDMPVTVAFNYNTYRMAITPDSSLQPDTLYSVTLKTGLLNLTGVPLLHPFQWSFRTRPSLPPPGAAPHITAIDPACYSKNIQPNAVFAITFSEPMDDSTFTSETVHLRAYDGEEDMEVEFAYEPSTHVVTITPAADLSYQTRYELTFDAEAILSSALTPAQLEGQTKFNFTSDRDPNAGGGDGGGDGDDDDPDGDGGSDDPDEPKPLKITLTYGNNTDYNPSEAVGGGPTITYTRPDGSSQTIPTPEPTGLPVSFTTDDIPDGSIIVITPDATDVEVKVADGSQNDGDGYFAFETEEDQETKNSTETLKGELNGNTYTFHAQAAPPQAQAQASNPKGGSLKPVNIIPDTGMAGTLGDVVPSNKKDKNAEKHFVTPQKFTGGIPGDYVNLTVKGMKKAVFEKSFEWACEPADAGEAVPGEAHKFRVKRDAAKKIEVIIKSKADSTKIMDTMNVWVVLWTVDTQIDTDVLLEHRSDPPPPRAFLDTIWSFKATVEPASILTKEDDIPDMNHKPKVHVPEWKKPHALDGLKFSDPKGRWNLTQQWRERHLAPSVTTADIGIPASSLLSGTLPNANIIQKTSPTNGADGFPVNELFGNDSTPDYDTSLPYSDKQLTGQDTPSEVIYDAAGNVGDTFESRVHFLVFVRAEIGKKWYRVSEKKPWRLSVKLKKVSETADDSDYNGDGDKNDLLWIDDGSESDATNDNW